MWAADPEEPVDNSTEPTPMDCTLAEPSELVSPDAEPTADNSDNNVSASVFTDVDTAVAEASGLVATGEVEVGAIILPVKPGMMRRGRWLNISHTDALATSG